MSGDKNGRSLPRKLSSDPESESNGSSIKGASGDKSTGASGSSRFPTTSSPLKSKGTRLPSSLSESSQGSYDNLSDVDEIVMEYPDIRRATVESPSKPKKPRTSSSPAKSQGSGNNSFEKLNASELMDDTDLKTVMETMHKNHYNIKVKVDIPAEMKCASLFKMDYHCVVVANESCANYPSSLIIPVAVEKNGNIVGPKIDFDSETYATKVKGPATHVRIRDRYPVPVILFNNKFICRSGTLGCRKSVIYQISQKSADPAMTENTLTGIIWDPLVKMVQTTVIRAKEIAKTILNVGEMEQLFCEDATVLELLKVKRIVDLMIEYRKVFFQTVNISSSEILHMDVYRGMKIQDLPYPGCEFFKDYKKAKRNPVGLKFNWSQDSVKRNLQLTDDDLQITKDIPELDIKEFDLVRLTQVYLKMLLEFLIRDSFNMVIHCISGWDRTPLFISMLRMSLWADGVIHQSLEYEDMAYLTVTYDWYLFGHNLPDRIKKEEEIMHFCFNFLPHIATDEYSITKIFASLPDDQRRGKNFPEYTPGRREKALSEISKHLLDAYEEYIPEPEEPKTEA